MTWLFRCTVYLLSAMIGTLLALWVIEWVANR